MELKECFDVFGGGYDDVMGRMLTEARVKKFLLMFLNDKSFNDLETAMENGDYDTAFRAAHTLKGLCANLGIKNLGEISSEITEALRAKDIDTAVKLLPQVAQCYSITVDALNQLD